MTTHKRSSSQDPADLPATQPSDVSMSRSTESSPAAETGSEASSLPVVAASAQSGDPQAQTKRGHAEGDGSSDLKRGAAVGGAAVGLAGLAAFNWERDAGPADEPKTSSPASTIDDDRTPADTEPPQPMALREGIAPGANELPLIIDELIDHADVVTDGVMDGIAVMPVEDGFEHVEQLREDMEPRIDHWVMPMDEPVPEGFQDATSEGDSFIVVGEEVVDPFLAESGEVVDPFVADIIAAGPDGVIIETEYQSPQAAEPTAWIITEGQPSELDTQNDATNDAADLESDEYY
jgi:hypothetical protein